MTLRTALVLLTTLPLLTTFGYADESVDSKRVHLTILEPVPSSQTDRREKLKVRVELDQPANYRRPDHVLIVLSDGKRKYADWAIANPNKDTKIYEISIPLTVLKDKNSFELYAEAVYTIVRDFGQKKANVIRVKTEPTRVTIK